MDNVRQILNDAREARGRINNLTGRIEFYRELATKATSSMEAVRVSGTGNRSRVEDAVVKLADIQSLLGRELDRSREVLYKAEELVGRLYGKYYDVMSRRYLEHMSWEKIAADLGYDKRWVFRLHGWALCELGRQIFEEQG